MIPLKDTTPSEKFPIANWVIIIINAIIFFMQISLDMKEKVTFVHTYGLVPSRTIIFGDYSHTFLTNIFLHGGWGHFLGNMWMLYIFGDNVEDRMGTFRYILFYLLTGLIASYAHYWLYSESSVPAIGASGAISGVMAAYMLLYPGSYILSFVPIFFLPMLIPIRAVIYIGIWFIGQFFSGTLDLLFNSTGSGIAFWAHIGGFTGGILMYKLFITKKRKRRYRTYYKYY